MGKLPIAIAVNTGRLPLTLEKQVGYRVKWGYYCDMLEIMIAFYKTRSQTCSPTCTHRQKWCILRSL